MKPEVRWPLFIVALLVFQVGVGMFFLWKATSDRSFSVEEDYYEKAVNWEQHQAQESANLELGWRLDCEVGSLNEGGGTRRLSALLATADEHPVSGASVRVEAFHNIRARDIRRADLTEVEPGRYEVLLPIRRPGLWEFRFTANRAGDTFTHRARIHVPRVGR